jgi:hypothetical protein
MRWPDIRVGHRDNATRVEIIQSRKHEKISRKKSTFQKAEKNFPQSAVFSADAGAVISAKEISRRSVFERADEHDLKAGRSDSIKWADRHSVDIETAQQYAAAAATARLTAVARRASGFSPPHPPQQTQPTPAGAKAEPFLQAHQPQASVHVVINVSEVSRTTGAISGLGTSKPIRWPAGGAENPAADGGRHAAMSARRVSARLVLKGAAAERRILDRLQGRAAIPATPDGTPEPAVVLANGAQAARAAALLAVAAVAEAESDGRRAAEARALAARRSLRRLELRDAARRQMRQRQAEADRLAAALGAAMRRTADRLRDAAGKSKNRNPTAAVISVMRERKWKSPSPSRPAAGLIGGLALGGKGGTSPPAQAAARPRQPAGTSWKPPTSPPAAARHTSAATQTAAAATPTAALGVGLVGEVERLQAAAAEDESLAALLATRARAERAAAAATAAANETAARLTAPKGIAPPDPRP